MKSGIVSLVQVVLLIACTSNIEAQSKEQLALPESGPRIALVKMLDWHRMNDSTLSFLQNDIIIFQFIDSDSTTTYHELRKSALWEDTLFMKKLYYRASKPNLERYLAFVKKSGFFTNNFIEKLREHALHYDSLLVEHPQNDGPPAGFSYEWLTHSQEWDMFTSKPDSIPWIEKQLSDTTMLLIWRISDYEEKSFQLTRQGSTWAISKN
jgi:hypothetical protein